LDEGKAAARRIERREPIPAAAKADRLQLLLICTIGRNVMLRRQQKPSQQQQFADMADLGPNDLGQAERGAANVTF
jgi:hypothetical protein